MPAIDVMDSTWLAARPSIVAAIVSQPANWRLWWPGLDLRVDEWRKEKGMRWYVDSVEAGRDIGLAGSAEVWLEPMHEGVVAHFFLRLDPGTGHELTWRRRDRITHHYRRRTKDAFWGLADELDPARMDRHTSFLHAPVT